MKAIVAGGRDFDYPEYMSEVLDFLSLPITEVVSGKQKSWNKKLKKAYGADYYGEQWAKARGIPIKPFYADWKALDRAAGPIRNGHMADYADILIAFWDGKSTGTGGIIQHMIDRKKPYIVFFY